MVYIIALLMMVLGLAGTFLPVLPGIPLIFVAIAGYGWWEGFHHITGHYLALVGALALLSVIVDYLAGVLGTRAFGSTRFGAWGSVIGGILGILTLGPLGLFLGPWLGAAVGELLGGQEFYQAVKAGTGALIGMLSGMVVKFVIGLGMLISFLVVTLPIV